MYSAGSLLAPCPLALFFVDRATAVDAAPPPNPSRHTCACNVNRHVHCGRMALDQCLLVGAKIVHSPKWAVIRWTKHRYVMFNNGAFARRRYIKRTETRQSHKLCFII